ncbi:hypothetical protein PtrSN002B_004833 [Pyrenophora tritici-repentis]|uniref:Nucleo-P87 domain containing protein n=2 Tax=Pyrenophora tritici-repentis TaxID=45151 RepID=A0A2W1EG06_9PLEO|nr:uncharacterized protein PTRG_04803 [Pyrenophora tritici-repentis Pt-1C-BFP]KAF7447053.1 hypothetical protein A1F99_085000 [Pyrenophora tritici-repentis]EDU47710.1 conserved hypothetical protein [Pyrenophora tritici-repentis Pt-1C-BFP]KAF7569344.1 Nucleo-P87 domain containing protein [Pyrenophora tritici-repentis]KAI0584053.1 hypothetical protein Alg130_05387 [Pyrenophora tritici-repentis]KAI0585899.1 hypothetical protein Alg215_02254 [Pyrenophora tritici-repentis]
MSAHARRLEHSLGSSWGEADYVSDEGGSFDSGSDGASELDLEDSDKEVVQERRALPTPRRHRNQQSPPVPTAQTKSTPVRKPTERKKTSQSQHLHSDKKGPRQHPFEPSFIMPSMDNSWSGFNLPPAQKPQRRKRRDTVPDRLSNASGIAPTSFKERRVDSHQEVSPWHYVSLFWENVLAPLIGHFLDVLSYALRYFIKPILGVLLGLGILAFSFRLASGMLRFTVSNVIMGPVCAIPGSSYLITACDTSYSSHHANFEEVTSVQSRFEDIVHAAKDTYSLPATIKNSELAIRDLRVLVRHSHLPSREALENEFNYFVLTANTASRELSRFNTQIGGASDRLVAANQWTMNVLSGIRDQDASTGIASRVIDQVVGTFVAGPPTLQERIYDQYIVHLGRNKEEITKLISKAQALLIILNSLDDRLEAILEIATRDDQTVTRNQEELLASLWTKLGGNRTNVAANAKALNLLSNISAYRKKAVMHVTQTLLKLQEIQDELENLREGVAAPEILGFRGDLPLEYHINAIGKGIERLQISRGEHMRVEAETYKKLMHAGEEGDDERREIGDGPTTITAKPR